MVRPSAWIRLVYLLISIFTFACSPTIRTNNGSSKATGNREFGISPKLQFFRTHPEKLKLFFAVSCSDLLYARSSEQDKLKAQVRITCTQFNSKTNENGWSVSRVFSINKSDCDGRWLDYLDMSDHYNFTGEVLVKVEDVNRGSSYTAYSNINKSRFESQKYLCLDYPSETPLLNEYYEIGDTLLIECGAPEQQAIFVTQYTIPSQAAHPPYADNLNSPIPEKQRDLKIPLENSKAPLPLSEQASLLEIRMEAERDVLGLILSFYKADYPNLKDGLDMLSPLVYICKTEEFNQLRAKDDSRKAAEEFWISRCKNKDRARLILAEYYRRVKHANQHFTSYIEGWKSDRGMVYIIYGKPESISRRPGEEIWIYGREINTVRLSFTFRQANNPFSFNHYELDRNPGYRAIWELATNTWRNGRIFSY